MAHTQDTLFSLELVIEKLYLPYVTCRFPAVAFRLLDFPTILISHVETDLSQRIKTKIKRDPYYHIPNQFVELQDKHGNFMMKKGKSCLFKIDIETLSEHLSNTPMYIMVIDEFPDVPKLLGNSSLALNELMDSIKVDVRKNGQTVPSAHGDKGLFKIVNLMGKEIGYIILGFRLLSLGPGLIAHLPAKSIASRSSQVKSSGPKNVIEEIIEVTRQTEVQSASPQDVFEGKRQMHKKQKEIGINDTQEIACMTDAEKMDALIQTVDIQDETLLQNKQKDIRNMYTQTSDIRKQGKPKPIECLKFTNESEEESDDGLFLKPNMFCPPPMYFNSDAKPTVQIERDDVNYQNYESTFEELSTENETENGPKARKQENNIANEPSKGNQDVQMKTNTETKVSENNVENPLLNSEYPKPDPSVPVFPILSALLMEISKIQNPEFLNQAMNPVQNGNSVIGRRNEPRNREEFERVSKASAYCTELAEKTEHSINKRKNKKNHKMTTGSNALQKQKSWIRKAPEVGVKKTNLVFGLTNTQRLRLARKNPSWLKSAECDVNLLKAQKQQLSAKTKEFDHEEDTGNLSDTYTEVRRLAAAELEKSTMGQTSMQEEVEKVKKRKKKMTKSRENSPAKVRGDMTRSKSPKNASKQEKVLNVDKEDVLPVPNRKGPTDPVPDSTPSSRIEVHIPSAPAEESDHDDTESFGETFEEDAGSDRMSRFPGFHKGDETLPEPILGEGTGSMNSTLDTTGDVGEDSPMESTRVSKQFRTVPDSLIKSTEDYDTKQFHSTDEPELQQLISDDEKSETMYMPSLDPPLRTKTPTLGTVGQPNNSTRLSLKFEVLNPTASKNSPLPALRRSQQTKVDSMNARPSPTETPRSRSSQSSPRGPTPRQRKTLRERRLELKKESIHTESVSSYMPSESENILSLISDGSYSDDFHVSSDRDTSHTSPAPEFPKLIPATKLGFTIS